MQRLSLTREDGGRSGGGDTELSDTNAQRPSCQESQCRPPLTTVSRPRTTRVSVWTTSEPQLFLCATKEKAPASETLRDRRPWQPEPTLTIRTPSPARPPTSSNIETHSPRRRSSPAPRPAASTHLQLRDQLPDVGGRTGDGAALAVHHRRSVDSLGQARERCGWDAGIRTPIRRTRTACPTIERRPNDSRTIDYIEG